MEEQDGACGSTWGPPQGKSRPDSPWSWVRARAGCWQTTPRAEEGQWDFPEHWCLPMSPNKTGRAAPRGLLLRRLHL